MSAQPAHHDCIVYLGPSLPWSEARKLYADAQYRPPARRGDLDAVASGSVVGLIDGVFDQELAVSPREVHNALARGVRIIASSSMGAMRAAEVRGVHGVGRVYDMFRRGIIERDDEVALTFDPDSYRALSEPLVNVRYAVQRLVTAGTLDRDKGRALVAAARRLPFRERDYRRILREAGLGGAQDQATLLELLRSHDLKREDAKLLLESLGEFRRQPAPPPTAAAAATRSEHEDHLSAIAARAHMPVDAPLLVWEYGERIDFADLVAFMKLTGSLLPHARAALARFALQGNDLEATEAVAADSGEAVRKLLVEVMAQWGWYGAEEARVTLVDLGMGLATLFERLEEETDAERALLELVRKQPPEFLEALRCELVMSDIALKREALRLGSLRVLAERSREWGAALTESELTSARAVLYRANRTLTAPEFQVHQRELGITPEQIDDLVCDLAHARRTATPLLAHLDPRFTEPAPQPRHAELHEPAPTPAHAHAHAECGTGELTLRPSPKAPGSSRFCLPLREGERAAERIAECIGVTRVAMVGELDELSVQIAQAYRPDSRWSTTAGSGKSETRAGARIGSVLEEAEKYAQERFQRVDRSASYAALSGEGGAVVDPRELDLPYDSRYQRELEIGWTRCQDLLSGEPCFVPAAAVIADRLRDDVYYSERHGDKVFSSSGLASGFTLEEALTHAVCEQIERHALRMAELQLSNPGVPSRRSWQFVALGTLPASLQRLARKLIAPGHSLRVLDITSEVRVPTFEARLYSLEEPGVFSASGTACHPNAEVALHMALLEAAQTKIGSVSGAREDLTISAPSWAPPARPRPYRKACHTFWYGADPPLTAFSTIESFVAQDALEDLRWVLEALRRAGVQRVPAIDYSLPELAPMRAVRVLTPGLESANPFHTGVRARVQALSDLLPQSALSEQLP